MPTTTLTTPKFWQAYWVTMRPYLLFVSGVAGMAGFALGAPQNVPAALAAFPAFFFAYGFGQALTDCFQTDTDALSSPYRPLVRGIIGKRQVLGISLAGLLGCCLILSWLNLLNLIPGALSVLGLATYTFFKRRWWAGPFYNAWIVALLPVMGYMAAVGYPAGPSAIFATVTGGTLVASVFFSYANFVLMGYFKDISADRASGYHTFVVRFGWRPAAWISDLFALISLAAGGTVIFSALAAPWPALAVFAAAAVVLCKAQWGIHHTSDETAAHRPIANVVRGFLLLHLAAILSFQPEWWLAALLFYGAFELTLQRRPEKGQV
ncbi:MAG: UbiA family prenyltransferase [Calditrichae bacterium]|nr:UbiA family prenyltransferase [Calditrichia bacterium]